METVLGAAFQKPPRIAQPFRNRSLSETADHQVAARIPRSGVPQKLKGTNGDAAVGGGNFFKALRRTHGGFADPWPA